MRRKEEEFSCLLPRDGTTYFAAAQFFVCFFELMSMAGVFACVFILSSASVFDIYLQSTSKGRRMLMSECSCMTHSCG